MDDDQTQQPKKRTFKKYTYRGVDLDQLLDKNNKELMELFTCRVRRRLSRGLKRKPMALMKKLRKAKKRGRTSREARSGENAFERYDSNARNGGLYSGCI